jgi:tetratricopeptide (TPR) repeat protein
MKQILSLILLLTSSSAIAQKQFSEKEIQKMAADAEKMAEKFKKDPRYKPGMVEAYEKKEASTNFPAKNKALMATIPNQPMNKGVMSAYLSNLYTAYKTKMPIGAVQAAQQASEALNNDANKIGITAVSNWYNGAPREAVLMAITASIKNPDNKMLLNNLGALLNMGGAPYHALPILKTLVSEFPKNPMFLNNLGQAYTGAGELDTAMYYFKRCLQESPNHPEANNTAGQIEASRGNTAAAMQYFENSLKGSYNTEAIKGLEKYGKGGNYHLSRFIKPPKDLPYFNEFKYKLPRQSQNAMDAPYVKQEHKDYKKFIQGVRIAYSELARQEEQKGMAKLEKVTTAVLKNERSHFYTPVQLAAQKKLQDFSMSIMEEAKANNQLIESLRKDIQKLQDDYQTKRQAIINDYAARRKGIECGEGNGGGCAALEQLAKDECQELSALSVRVQGQIATTVADKQQKELQWAQRVFKTSSFYGYLQAPNKEMANAAFYKACVNYLSQLEDIAGTPIVIAFRCEREAEAAPKSESDNTKSMECPIDISIPFVVGKLELNCEKFSFSGGEGIMLKYEKNFKTKQSTLSIGAGLQFEAGKAFGIFSGEVSASAEQSFYIVFDGDNNFSDAGLALQVEASVGAEAGIETPGEIGKEYLTKEIIDVKGEFGYTLGVNSGWNFSDGTLNAIAKSIGGIMKK